VKIPVSVKTRIGIDKDDSWEFFLNFVEKINCKYIIVHARKAWLKGLSPKENRTVPPLNYETVFKLKEMHSDWKIVLNGGVKNLDEAKAILKKADGVMIGRAACETPWILASADSDIFGEKPDVKSRDEILERFLPYAQSQVEKGVPPSFLRKPLMGLFHGMPGAKKYRESLRLFPLRD